MARLSELAMAAGEATADRNILARLVELFSTSGVERNGSASVSVSIDRFEYHNLKRLLQQSQRSLDYWQKRCKRGR